MRALKPNGGSLVWRILFSTNTDSNFKGSVPEIDSSCSSTVPGLSYIRCQLGPAKFGGLENCPLNRKTRFNSESRHLKLLVAGPSPLGLARRVSRGRQRNGHLKTRDNRGILVLRISDALGARDVGQIESLKVAWPDQEALTFCTH
eukprot:scaffold147730_cov49-Prasinocladus_malaysianus.AAC.1